MTLLVRDEQDIVAANLDYHLARGVDRIIVTDNRSEDATVQIVREYERTGAVRLLFEAGDDFSQSRWVTRMARLAAVEEAADWVINCDADEFWWPQYGDLKTCFRRLPATAGVVVAPRRNFVPASTEVAPFYERLTLRAVKATNPRGRPLPPKVAHRSHPQIEVALGNHRVEGPVLGETVSDGGLEILHFPMRTYAQFERKIVNGGRAVERNAELGGRRLGTWRRLYGAWEEGRLESFWESAVNERPLVEDLRLRDFMAGLACRGLHDPKQLRDPAPAIAP